MKKILSFALVAGLMLSPLMASASTNNVLFDPNGSGSTQVDVGSSVTMHAYVDSTSSQELESVFVKFVGANGLAAQGICYTVNPSKIGTSPAGGWDISIPVTVPTNAGVWPVSLTWYGINGDGADTTCTGPTVFSTQSFSNRITVTDVNSTATQTGNSGGGSTVGTQLPWQSSIDALNAKIAALMSSLTSLTTLVGSMNTAPAKPACPPSGDTSMVQSWLMSNGYGAGFYAAGIHSATGFWGPITTAAYAQASAACK